MDFGRTDVSFSAARAEVRCAHFRGVSEGVLMRFLSHHVAPVAEPAKGSPLAGEAPRTTRGVMGSVPGAIRDRAEGHLTWR